MKNRKTIIQNNQYNFKRIIAIICLILLLFISVYVQVLLGSIPELHYIVIIFYIFNMFLIIFVTVIFSLFTPKYVVCHPNKIYLHAKYLTREIDVSNIKGFDIFLTNIRLIIYTKGENADIYNGGNIHTNLLWNIIEYYSLKRYKFRFFPPYGKELINNNNIAKNKKNIKKLKYAYYYFNIIIVIMFINVAILGGIYFAIMQNNNGKERSELMSSTEAMEYAERFILVNYNTTNCVMTSIDSIDNREDGLSEMWRCEYFINLSGVNEVIWYKFSLFFGKSLMDLMFEHGYMDDFIEDSNGTLFSLRKFSFKPFFTESIYYRDSTEIVPLLVSYYKDNYWLSSPENITLSAVFYTSNYWRINYVFKNSTGDYIFSYHLYYHLDSNQIDVDFQYINRDGRRVYTDPENYPPHDLIDFNT